MRKLPVVFVWLRIAISAAGAVNPAPVPFIAPPVPLADVRLTGGPLKHAQDLDRAYLLKLDPDRLLYFLRQRAGLAPKASRGNGGWDGGEGKQITGHIAGHYLSAVSLMWSATGDARFKERADYVVSELQAIQAAQGDGYIGALTDAKGVPAKELFAQVSRGDIRSAGFDLNGLWSPWYVEHKLFAGLRDAYRQTGNQTALAVEVKFAEWVERTLASLSDEQIQKMLNTEFGGMNEVAVDIYRDTGDPRWLALAERFHHRAVVDPLARGEDVLGSKHGNTQVPKLLGSLARYIATGNEADGRAARFFWERVAAHHSFATGGHGKNEYFGQPDKLAPMIDGRTAETCNVYNMLKLTRMLMALQPDVRYGEFHERALFNHILASIDPDNGATCYMVPVGRGVTREYERDMLDGEFTCCVGSGMESHALHGDGLYYATADRLWVNVFAPSVVEWRAAGLRGEMQTDFPQGERAKFILHGRNERPLTVSVRWPTWTGDGFRLSVNGAAVDSSTRPDGFVDVTRVWRDGDTIEWTLPKSLHLEPLPDDPHRAAILWGPLVLAADLGPEGEDGKPSASAPALVTDDRPVTEWLNAVADAPGVFRTVRVGRDGDVLLRPLYQVHRRTYAVYWDLFTETAWRERAAVYRAEEERRRHLEAATVAFVQPGEMQPETDFHFRTDAAAIARVQDRAARRGGTWMEFDVPVERGRPLALIVTFTNDERAAGACEISVDGAKLADRRWTRRSPEIDERWEDVECALPASVGADRPRATVRLQAQPGGQLPAVVGLRVVRVGTR